MKMVQVNFNTVTHLQKITRRLAQNAYTTRELINEFDLSIVLNIIFTIGAFL